MIKAVFRGRNGSMGFVEGQVYDLRTYIQADRIVLTDGTRRCPYESFEAVLRNWEVIAWSL